MRILALALATTAALAFAVPVSAQNSDLRGGGPGASSGNAVSHDSGSSRSGATRSGGSSQSSQRGADNAGPSAGNRSDRSGGKRASLRGEPAGTSAHGRTARVDIRRPAGNRVVIHRNRSRHFVAFNQAPSSRTTIIRKRHGARYVVLHHRRPIHVVASAPVSRTVLIRRHRHPGVMISGGTRRTMISRHPASEVNVRANVRPRETAGSSGRMTTTTGSSSTRSTTGSSSNQGSQSSSKQPAGNAAKSGGQGGAQGASPKGNQPGQGSSQ